MSKSDDLLREGKVTQDDDDSKVIIHVPVKVKKIAIDNNGIELYAVGLKMLNNKAEAWTPTIKDSNWEAMILDPDWQENIENEDGETIPNPISQPTIHNPVPQPDIPNPISALEAAISFNQDRVAWDFEQLLNTKAAQAAITEAEAQKAILI